MARPIRDGYHTVTVNLNLKNVEKTIDFIKQAFGGEEHDRATGPDGKIIHCALKVGDSNIHLSEAVREPPTPSQISLYVQDCDAVFAKAQAAGATVIFPMQDMFFGDRVGRVEDSAGNRWQIATHKEDVPREERARRGEAFRAEQAKKK